jgi:hypothetical protein
MRRFKRQIEAGELPDQADLETLAIMFGEVIAAADDKSLKAQSVKRAFRLESGRGRKPDTPEKNSRKRSFALMIERRRAEKDETLEQALYYATCQFNVPDDTGRKWHTQYRQDALFTLKWRKEFSRRLNLFFAPIIERLPKESKSTSLARDPLRPIFQNRANLERTHSLIGSVENSRRLVDGLNVSAAARLAEQFKKTSIAAQLAEHIEKTSVAARAAEALKKNRDKIY